MIVVYGRDECGKRFSQEFSDIILASEYKNQCIQKRFWIVDVEYGEYVNVTKMGVDGIVAGILPDGTEYQWRKRRN